MSGENVWVAEREVRQTKFNADIPPQGSGPGACRRYRLGLQIYFIHPSESYAYIAQLIACTRQRYYTAFPLDTPRRHIDCMPAVELRPRFPHSYLDRVHGSARRRGRDSERTAPTHT
jgi:hypothetical protein